ncbi:hypothetical protein [Kitasatospora sp. NPDC088783]|uniref:hypothetical protein n=1 Tax=Kitasatospora sp. NPDC088783 TaxID=3364077 RepID=UPI0037F22827
MTAARLAPAPPARTAATLHPAGAGTPLDLAGLPADDPSVLLVRRLAGAARLRSVGQHPSLLTPFELYDRHGVHRTGLVVLYALAGHVRRADIGARRGALERAEVLDAHARVLLRLLAAGPSTARLALVLGISLPAARERIAQLMETLGVQRRHQAAAVGALAGIVTADDVRPAAEPPADATLPAWADGQEASALLKELGRGRALAVVPHPGQQHLVEAVVAATRPGRVLVVASGDAEWAHTAARWRATGPQGVPVVAVLDTADRTRPAVRALRVGAPLSVGADSAPRQLADRRPLIAVATPAGAAALAQAHERCAGVGVWDLLVDLNPLTPGSGHAHTGRIPAWSRLTVSAIEDAATADRLRRTQLTEHVPHPVLLRATPRHLAAAGACRPHRLIAAAPPRRGSTPRQSLHLLLADLAVRYRLRRILLLCSSPPAAADALTGFGTAPGPRESGRPATWWAEPVPVDADRRARVLQQFADGRRELLVLATPGPLPGVTADAVVHLAPRLATAHTLDVLGHALAAGPQDARLLLVAPVFTAPAAPPVVDHLDSLSRAVAALDPDHREALRRARRLGRYTGQEPWLEHATTVPAAIRGVLARAAAWADTTLTQAEHRPVMT